MNVIKRLTRSVMKRLPGGIPGISYYERYQAKKGLFRSCSGELTASGRDPDQVYQAAFERIFLLLSAFYINGLRGDFLEFGVHRGFTANLFANNLKNYRFDNCRLHLFDSFEGFPEGDSEDKNCHELVHGIWREGIMALPKGADKFILSGLSRILGVGRVHVVKGFFEDVVDQHIKHTQIKKAMLVHVDCDLYSSSKFVLQKLMEYDLLQEGTVIICDDWMSSFGNPNVGQRKAVNEILQEHPQWIFEPYFNYGFGSQVFVAHNLETKFKR